MGTISMENYKVRKCMEHIDEIINMSVLNENRQVLMKLTISHYKDPMIIMIKKDGEYTDQDLTTYHVHAPEFFQSWIDLYGRQGVTNYIHMIGVGHFYRYMKRYKNLNKYSQQGWEALNALIKKTISNAQTRAGK